MRLSNRIWVSLLLAFVWVVAGSLRPAFAQDKSQPKSQSATAQQGKDKSTGVPTDKASPAPALSAAGSEPKTAPATEAKSAKSAKDAKQPESPPTGTPEAKAATSSGGPPAASAPAAGVDGSTYVVRMRDLSQRIDELKEQIRRSHTRLSLLSDTILSGGVGGARAEIVFTNDLSSAFRLVRALFVLDGAVQYNKQDDTGALAEQKSIPIFSGSIPPGDHTLQVLIKLQGYGYGVFSYLRGYKFEFKSTHSFTVAEGKTMRVEAVAWEKGGVTTPLEQRPAIRYVEKFAGASGGKPEAPAPGSTKGTQVKGGVSVGTGGQ